MTDPVDTDALRARADDDDALGYPEAAALQRATADELDRLRARVAELEQDASRLLRAAADEVDRLRAELGTQQRVDVDLKRAADMFLNENERLRAWIENAPHALGCAAGHSVAAVGSCTCWKADAL